MLLAVLALAFALQGAASDPGSTVNVHTDRFGDPLPPGAVLRLGTVRLHHAANVTAVAFSADGALIASGSGPLDQPDISDYSVRIWEVATGKSVRRLMGHKAKINRIAFDPKGKLLASGDAQGALILWDLTSGRQLWELLAADRDHTRGIQGLAFSNDGKTLAAGVFRGTHWWDTASGRHLGEWSAADDVAFSADGTKLTYLGGRSFGVIDLLARRAVAEHEPPGSDEDDSDVENGHHKSARLQNAQTVVYEDKEGNVHLLDTHTGKRTAFLPRALPKPKYGWPPLCVSPNGRFVASTLNGLVCLDLQTKKTVRFGRRNAMGVVPDEFMYWSLAISPDSKVLATGGADRRVRLWEIATGKEILPVPELAWGGIYATLSADGKTVGTLDEMGVMRLLAAREWCPDPSSWLGKKPVTAFAFAPDNRTLAVSRPDALVLEDLRTGNEIRKFALPFERAHFIVFSGDGALVAAGKRPESSPGQDLKKGTVRNSPDLMVWEVNIGRPLSILQEARSLSPTAAALSIDGRTLAVGDSKGKVQVWDTRTGKRRTVRTGKHEDEVSALVFSRDGRFLATAERYGDVSLWNMTDGRRRRLNPRVWGADFMAFSADGRLLTANVDRHDTVVSDAATGKPWARLSAQEGPATSLSFAPDGNTIVTGHADGTALVWDVTAVRRSAQGDKPKVRADGDGIPMPAVARSRLGSRRSLSLLSPLLANGGRISHVNLAFCRRWKGAGGWYGNHL
jgi:WD40 repeat protein